MEIIDIMYEEKLEAYIEVGNSGKWYEWDISEIELAELLGIEVKTNRHIVSYDDGRGECIIENVIIDGVPIEYFFFKYDDLIKAAILLYSKLN